MNPEAQEAQPTIKPRSELAQSLDRGFIWVTRLFALGVAAILLWIAVQVASKSLPAIK